MDNKLIVVGGATGNLGGRIARALLQQGAGVVALVRHDSAPEQVEELRTLGATIAEVDFSNLAAVTSACSGASCDTAAFTAAAALDSSTPRFLAGACGNHLTCALGDPSELDGALREEVGETLEVIGDRVKPLVERDKLWPLQVPMSLLGLVEQIDRIGQVRVQQRHYLRSDGFDKAVLGTVHNLNSFQPRWRSLA